MVGPPQKFIYIATGVYNGLFELSGAEIAGKAGMDDQIRTLKYFKIVRWHIDINSNKVVLNHLGMV